MLSPESGHRGPLSLTHSITSSQSLLSEPCFLTWSEGNSQKVLANRQKWGVGVYSQQLVV